MIDGSEFFSVHLSTEKAKMVVEFSSTRLLQEANNIPVSCNRTPELFFRFDVEQACSYYANTGRWTVVNPCLVCLYLYLFRHLQRQQQC